MQELISAIAGQTVTLTAQVTPSAGGGANNGFVLFQDNGLPLALVPVDSTGAAKFTTTKLSLGAQTQSRVEIGDCPDDFAKRFVIGTHLDRNDPLPAGGDEHVARKSCHEKVRALELTRLAVQPETEPL